MGLNLAIKSRTSSDQLVRVGKRGQCERGKKLYNKHRLCYGVTSQERKDRKGFNQEGEGVY